MLWNGMDHIDILYPRAYMQALCPWSFYIVYTVCHMLIAFHWGSIKKCTDTIFHKKWLHSALDKLCRVTIVRKRCY